MNGSPHNRFFHYFSRTPPFLISAAACLFFSGCKLDGMKRQLAELEEEEEFLENKLQAHSLVHQLNLREAGAVRQGDLEGRALEKDLALLEQQLSTLKASIASEKKRVEECESYLKRYASAPSR